ncbi:MAG: methyltransferase type 12 [Hyphomicrobiales bacterium]|nr:methyltransferase type 12 [Hyphomicrobiales bacterium]
MPFHGLQRRSRPNGCVCPRRGPSHESSGDLLADRRYAWATGAAREGDHAGAADLLAQTLELTPGWAPASVALGDSLRALGDESGAARAYEAAAARDPSGVLGAQLRLAALGRAPAPASAPGEYVRALFDEYAPRFDAHLTGALDYRGPALLRAALERVRAPLRFARALDLGCGTGLMAAALAGTCETTIGVDLSPRMVEAARRTGLYARAEVGDVTAFLNGEPAGGADLALAADVFVYMGDLAPVFAAARAALAQGGLFAFSVQKGASDWALGADLRYAHGAGYLARLAAEHGFAIAVCDEASTRKDAGLDVPGLVVVLARA